MDAAHMMRTINRLHAEGIRHFAMVHDSYGVHACDLDLLNRVLREEFVGSIPNPSCRISWTNNEKPTPGSLCRIRPKPETSIFSRSSRLPTFLPDRLTIVVDHGRWYGGCGAEQCSPLARIAVYGGSGRRRDPALLVGIPLFPCPQLPSKCCLSGRSTRNRESRR